MAISPSEASFDHRRVVQGTCGWTDASLIQCGRFYPGKKSSKSSEKLEFYSRGGGFGCVEVDCSTYSLQTAATVQSWVQATPKMFKFHFKVFGLFSNLNCDSKYIPHDVKAGMLTVGDRVDLSKLDERVSTELWRRFNESVYPAFIAGKLGVILFQFQNNFAPGPKSFEHLNYCSRMLDSRYSMAIEFRNRDWISASTIQHTLDFLRNLRAEGAVLVASDDLPHEMTPTSSLQSSKDNSNHYSNDVFKVVDPFAYDSRSASLPTILTCRSSGICAYIRVHRRSGSKRVLSESELSLWNDRIGSLFDERGSNSTGSNSSSISSSIGKAECDDTRSNANRESHSVSLNGPIYMLWGTDHEDQGIVNARNFQKILPEAVRLNWYSYYKSSMSSMYGLGGSIVSAGSKRPLDIANADDANAGNQEAREDNRNLGPTEPIAAVAAPAPTSTSITGIGSPTKKSILNYFSVKK